MTKLRGRTGRIDAALGAHSSKADAAYVGSYCLGQPEDEFARGAARFANVMSDPPRRGRTKITNTLSLSEMVTEYIREATEGSGGVARADPEED